MRTPTPENKHPKIPSRGCSRWTPHTYVRTEMVNIAPRDQPEDRAWAHIFRCDVTDVERRFGLETIGGVPKVDPDDPPAPAESMLAALDDAGVGWDRGVL